MEAYTSQRQTEGISDQGAELCLNCWYFTDDTGVVIRIAAKAYALTGSDDEKLRMLRMLSATDHLTAHHDRVPEKCVIAVDGEEMKGAVPASVMQTNDAIMVFDALIEKVEQSIPDNIRSINNIPEKFRLKFEEPLLWVSTCVYESQDGSLVARVSQ